MRRLYRYGLPATTKLELRQRQIRCSSKEVARVEWKAFRASAKAKPLLDSLRATAGVRNRCFYCSDGRAADVDHYMPIKLDFGLTFSWDNHLWVCPECNRSKNAKPPVNGAVWVIDPTRIDPWTCLTLDTSTGLIAPRFFVGVGPSDRGAAATLDLFKALTWEEVIEGRARSIRRLRTAAAAVTSIGDVDSTRRPLIEATAEDDYGVARWFALWEGSLEVPFAALRVDHPTLWRRFVSVAIR